MLACCGVLPATSRQHLVSREAMHHLSCDEIKVMKGVLSKTTLEGCHLRFERQPLCYPTGRRLALPLRSR